MSQEAEHEHVHDTPADELVAHATEHAGSAL